MFLHEVEILINKTFELLRYLYSNCGMKRPSSGCQFKASGKVSLFDMQPSSCKQTYRSSFIPGLPDTFWNSSLKHSRLVCRRPNNIRVARSRSALSAPTSQLSPPNEDVDWIFVDTIVKTQVPCVSKKLEREVQDDALSLVRVALRDASTELCVVLCDDKEISTLNSQWRGIDKATDVLSFPQNDPDMVVLGDIVISVETAVKQAEEREYEVRDEIRVLLVHGLLHLMGYDHEGGIEGDWLVMAKMKNQFLKRLGWQGEGLISSAQQDTMYRDIAQS